MYNENISYSGPFLYITTKGMFEESTANQSPSNQVVALIFPVEFIQYVENTKYYLK